MSYVRSESVTVTTIADGSATAYTSENYNGRIVKVIYTKDDYDDGVDFTITTETTGQNVWVESDVNASAAVLPREATHDTVGAASLYAAAGEAVEDYIRMVDERLQIVIGSGGNVTNGAFRLIVE